MTRYGEHLCETPWKDKTFKYWLEAALKKHEKKGVEKWEEIQEKAKGERVSSHLESDGLHTTLGVGILSSAGFHAAWNLQYNVLELLEEIHVVSTLREVYREYTGEEWV